MLSLDVQFTQMLSLDVRITLQGAVSGERFALAGIGNAANDWSIPASKFSINQILGQPLAVLAQCCGCGMLTHQYSCRDCNLPQRSCSHCGPRMTPPHMHKVCHSCGGVMQPTLSKAPARALLDARGQIRTFGELRDPSLADNKNRVRVLFGTEKLFEEFFNKSCKDVQEVHTPTTPTPQTPSPSLRERSRSRSRRGRRSALS